MTSNYIDKQKYRNLWCKHLEIINELKKLPDLISCSNVKIDLVKNYIILTILARNEILQYSKNIDLAIANCGLDCGDLLFYNLIQNIELYNPLKTDEKTRQNITKILQLRDDDANEKNLCTIFLNSNWKLNLLLRENKIISNDDTNTNTNTNTNDDTNDDTNDNIDNYLK